MNKWSLPSSWEWSSLEDVVDVGSHNIEPSDDPEKMFSYIALENIEKSTGRLVDFVPQKGRQIRSAKTVFNAGDVLYGKLRPYLQKTIIAPFEGVSVTDIVPLKPYGDGRFVFRYLLGPDHLAYISPLMAGIRMPRLRTGDLMAMPIPCAPLNEQRRIADKIDALQAKSRRAREALKAVGPLLEKFRQSVLAAAFRGDLTAEWREQHPDVEPAEKLLERIRTERRNRWEEGELAKMRAKGIKPKDDQWKAKYTEPEPVDATGLPELPKGWCWANLGEIIVGGPQNGLYVPKSRYGKGTRILRIDDYQAGWTREPDALQQVAIDAVDAKRFGLSEGSVVVNRVNSMSHLGKATVITKEMLPLVFESNMMAFSLSLSVSKAYVDHWLNSKDGRYELVKNAKHAVNQASINQTDVQSALIPLPPEDEMKAIGGLVALTLQRCMNMCRLFELSQSGLSQLDQSILAKAFRGELVPQDPNDEPASVLLERIKAEREAGTGKKKTRKKTE